MLEQLGQLSRTLADSQPEPSNLGAEAETVPEGDPAPALGCSWVSPQARGALLQLLQVASSAD